MGRDVPNAHVLVVVSSRWMDESNIRCLTFQAHTCANDLYPIRARLIPPSGVSVTARPMSSTDSASSSTAAPPSSRA